MSVRNFYTIRKSQMPNLMSSTLKFLYGNTYCIHPMLSMVEQLNKEHLMLLDSLERVNSSTILERKKKKGKRGGW